MEQTVSAVLLGILQGFTEFLPVSSSGHLVLAQRVLPGFSAPPAAFEALLHAGTLAAVVAFFRRDILAFLSSAGTREGRRLPLLILLGSLPAAVIGLSFRRQLEGLFASPVVAAAGLLVTAGLLLVAWRFGRGERASQSLGWGEALLIGAFQAVAIAPGVSRSGATIACALLLGLAGREAARFSFLLSLPAVAGAVLLEGKEVASSPHLGAFLLGTAAAAAVGYLAIAWMMRLLARRTLLPFAVYCAVLGSLSLLLLV